MIVIDWMVNVIQIGSRPGRICLTLLRLMEIPMYEAEPDPFPELEYLTKTFKKGDFVVYEHRRTANGVKHTCSVIGVSLEGWVLDINVGTYFSQSFRLKDVIVWEHGKRKGK
jgi:hypothetical protein